MSKEIVRKRKLMSQFAVYLSKVTEEDLENLSVKEIADRFFIDLQDEAKEEIINEMD